MADNELMARLVYDGGDAVLIPPEMGTPREDQMQGSPIDRVTELCGRICYDSLGKGRNSAEYHKHIRDSRHFSVLMHAPITCEVSLPPGALLHNWLSLANRPGAWFTVAPYGMRSVNTARVTINLAAIAQWERFTPPYVGELGKGSFDLCEVMGRLLYYEMRKAAPLAATTDGDTWGNETVEVRRVEPEFPEERWISLYLRGGRTMSHEQVRHHYHCAVSQRSSRYCDEDGSPVVTHPLLDAYMADGGTPPLYEKYANVIESARQLYRDIIADLTPWWQAKHPELSKLDVRKQVRGAARGILPMSLSTEMIFSASVSQWLFMLNQRACEAADAEIRCLFAGYEGWHGTVIDALRNSRYSNCFEHLVGKRSADGIGNVVTGD